MKDLKSHYNQIYSKGAYSKYFTFKSHQEMTAIIEGASWMGKRVLEIGCGEGDLASMIAIYGGDVLAIDYSEEAIKIAQKRFTLDNCKFVCQDYNDVSGKYDIVVMSGVLEHVEDPYDTLRYIKDNFLLDKDSKIISSSPSFLNVRGYVWLTLQLLFDVPMSLSDVHFLCPFDMEEFAAKLGGRLAYKSYDQDWGHGERLIIDFEKRLVNALRDAGMKGDVKRMISWLKKTLPYNNYSDFSGANITYTITFGE